MITRLGTRLRAAGIAELAGDDVSIRASGPATVLRSLRELFPQAALAWRPFMSSRRGELTRGVAEAHRANRGPPFRLQEAGVPACPRL